MVHGRGWTPCSKTCGGGTRSEEYNVRNSAENGGASCEASHGEIRTEECNTQPCPIDCDGSWTEWGECSSTCGTGTQQRNYQISVSAQHGGNACSENDGQTENRSCPDLDPCPVDCVGSWGDYGTCTSTCGGGTKRREYSITTPAAHGGQECPANNGETEDIACNTQPCPVDCVGSWGEWGECSEECGDGSKRRTYSVTIPAENGGVNCENSHGDTQDQVCNEGSCDSGFNVDGEPIADIGQFCDDWSANGECTNNPGYMLQNCATSCASLGMSGYATMAENRVMESNLEGNNPIADIGQYCRDWATNGECDNNPGYMLQNCATSCAGVGATGYATMDENRAMESNLDGNPIADIGQYCGDWANNGECDNNPGYMLQNCATSCARVGATGYATV